MELLSPELDGVNLTTDSLDESDSNEVTVVPLFKNADPRGDYTLPLEELVAQSSGPFGCDEEVNTRDISLEEQNFQSHSDVADNESLNPSQFEEREEKLLSVSIIIYFK